MPITYKMNTLQGDKFYQVDAPLYAETIRRIDRAKSYADIKAIVLAAVRSSLIDDKRVTDMRGKTLAQIAAEISEQQLSHNTANGDIVAVVVSATDKWLDICSKMEFRLSKATSRRAALKIFRDFMIDRVGLPNIGDALLAGFFRQANVTDSLARLALKKSGEKMQSLLLQERKRTKPAVGLSPKTQMQINSLSGGCNPS